MISPTISTIFPLLYTGLSSYIYWQSVPPASCPRPTSFLHHLLGDLLHQKRVSSFTSRNMNNLKQSSQTSKLPAESSRQNLKGTWRRRRNVRDSYSKRWRAWGSKLTNGRYVLLDIRIGIGRIRGSAKTNILQKFPLVKANTQFNRTNINKRSQRPILHRPLYRKKSQRYAMRIGPSS